MAKSQYTKKPMQTFSNKSQIDESTLQSNTVEICWFDEGEYVGVNPRDQKRFQIHKDRAIEILQNAVDAGSQLDLLLDHIVTWADDNSNKVSEVYVTLRDDRFILIAISNKVECDDDLEDSISDLDIKIAQDPDLRLINLNTLVLPPTSDESIELFLDNRFRLVHRVKCD